MPVHPEVIILKAPLEQKEWVQKKAETESTRRGRSVSMSAVIRALIQQQMDLEEEFERVDDAEV
jgi:hypothetical protein